MDRQFALVLDLNEGYQFTVRFDTPDVRPLLVDEPPPVGRGAGPNPARLLGAALGGCLGASLLFCLRKARMQPSRLSVHVTGELARNREGRLRIAGIRVRLLPAVDAADRARLTGCLTVFEDYCIVTQSVRDGIPVEVEVSPEVGPAAHAGAEAP